MYGMAIARIAYTQRAPMSIHGSSKRFRALVTYRERTPISSVSRVRKSYIEMSRLAALARKRDICLVCFCAPKACHADIIKRTIEAINRE